MLVAVEIQYTIHTYSRISCARTHHFILCSFNQFGLRYLCCIVVVVHTDSACAVWGLCKHFTHSQWFNLFRMPSFFFCHLCFEFVSLLSSFQNFIYFSSSFSFRCEIFCIAFDDGEYLLMFFVLFHFEWCI